MENKKLFDAIDEEYNQKFGTGERNTRGGTGERNTRGGRGGRNTRGGRGGRNTRGGRGGRGGRKYIYYILSSTKPTDASSNIKIKKLKFGEEDFYLWKMGKSSMIESQQRKLISDKDLNQVELQTFKDSLPLIRLIFEASPKSEEQRFFRNLLFHPLPDFDINSQPYSTYEIQSMKETLKNTKQTLKNINREVKDSDIGIVENFHNAREIAYLLTESEGLLNNAIDKLRGDFRRWSWERNSTLYDIEFVQKICQLRMIHFQKVFPKENLTMDDIFVNSGEIFLGYENSFSKIRSNKGSFGEKLSNRIASQRKALTSNWFHQVLEDISHHVSTMISNSDKLMNELKINTCVDVEEQIQNNPGIFKTKMLSEFKEILKNEQRIENEKFPENKPIDFQKYFDKERAEMILQMIRSVHSFVKGLTMIDSFKDLNLS